jgi:hypothetical protein
MISSAMVLLRAKEVGWGEKTRRMVPRTMKGAAGGSSTHADRETHDTGADLPEQDDFRMCERCARGREDACVVYERKNAPAIRPERFWKVSGGRSTPPSLLALRQHAGCHGAAVTFLPSDTLNGMKSSVFTLALKARRQAAVATSEMSTYATRELG